MKKMNNNIVIKKISIVVLVIVATMLLTNPGMKRFKEFGGKKTAMEGRLANFFIFSLYERYEKSPEGLTVRTTYVGALLNFFKADQKDWRTDYK